MQGRTVILVSHHVQLSLSGATYVVALDNGRVVFQGDRETFQASDVIDTLVHSGGGDSDDKDKEPKKERRATIDASTSAVPVLATEEPGHSNSGEATGATTPTETDPNSEVSSTAFTSEDTAKADKPQERKSPRKLVEEEKRAVGHIRREIWETYIKALGGWKFWTVFVFAMILGALSPVLENWWLKWVAFESETRGNVSNVLSLRTWSGADPAEAERRGPVFYVSIYAAVRRYSMNMRYPLC